MTVRPFTRRAFLSACTAAAGAALLPGPAAARPGAPAPARPLLNVFSKHLQWLGYDALAEVAAEAGFDGVDLTVRPGGHVVPERVADDLPRAVEALRGAGLQAPMMTTALTSAAEPFAEPVLRTAAAAGIRFYRMGWVQYDEAGDPVALLEALRPQFRALAALNARHGLHAAYQNHAGHYVGGAVWDLAWLLRGLDPRWIGCQYDIRHATVEGANTWPLGLRVLHPYVRTLVVKDFRWVWRDGRSQIEDVPVGEGTVDFAAYLSLVRSLGIEAPVSVHFEYPEAEARGLDGAARRAEVVRVMRRDRERLQGLLSEAGWG